MAKKFGYNLSNRRNREIFGPSWSQVMLIVAISLALIGLLFWMFSGEEAAEQEATEEATEEVPPAEVAEETEETVTPEEAVTGECPLPSIPIVEFTEEDLYADETGDASLPDDCKAGVEDSKRQLAKLFSNAKNAEADVIKAEERLAEEIAGLEDALDRLYEEKNNLERARACPAATEESAAADVQDQQIVR